MQRVSTVLLGKVPLRIFVKIYLSQLSNHFENSTAQNGEALVALATVKQVRDFLCGSLKFKNAALTQTIHPATIQVAIRVFG